jgi:hypothetical protein
MTFPSVVIGNTSRVGGVHAVRLSTMRADGFAQAICRSNVWALVDHRDELPIPATADGVWGDRPSCLGCARKLDREVTS